jgi:hypothetical protein
MTLPRREFLRTGVLSVVSAGFLLSSARMGLAQKPFRGPADIPLEAQQDPVFRFAPDTFKPYIGGFFESPNARGEMIELQLLSVTTYRPTKTARALTTLRGDVESFSLQFKAAAQLPLFNSIYLIRHQALGDFYLFLTPRKNDDGDLFYEAVISHLQ